MIVQPSSSRVGAPVPPDGDPASVDSEQKPDDEEQTKPRAESVDTGAKHTPGEEKGNNEVSPGETMDTTTDTTTKAAHPNVQQEAVLSWKRVALHAARFVSAFRGRTIHGLRVEIPRGYVGVVLRANGGAETDNGRPRVTTWRRQEIRDTDKRKTRASRAMHNRQDLEADWGTDGETEESAMNGEQSEGSDQKRTLRITDQFSSFVLWHPDYPVDEGKDEYFKSLTEWTKLASIIHRVEDGN